MDNEKIPIIKPLIIVNEDSEGTEKDDQSVIVLDSDKENLTSKEAQKDTPEIEEISSDIYLNSKKRLELEEKNYLNKFIGNGKRKNTQISLSNSENNCSICYSNKYLFTAKCRHICCKNCWKIWLSEHKRCPVCRQFARIKNLSPA